MKRRRLVLKKRRRERGSDAMDNKLDFEDGDIDRWNGLKHNLDVGANHNLGLLTGRGRHASWLVCCSPAHWMAQNLASQLFD